MGSRGQEELTEHVDHANGAADSHQSRQSQNHLLGVSRVLLLLLVVRLLSLIVILTSFRRRLALQAQRGSSRLTSR